MDKVYPGVDETVLYSSTPIEEYSDLMSISPILLFDRWSDEYRFGIMEVRVHV